LLEKDADGYKNFSRLVLSSLPLTEYRQALYKAPDNQTILTQFDMDSVERLELLKFDFLGLKTLTVIDKAERFVSEGPNSKDSPGFEPGKVRPRSKTTSNPFKGQVSENFTLFSGHIP